MNCSRPGCPGLHNLLSLLKLMSIESVMPVNHLILCCLLLLPSIFPSIRERFPMSQLFISGGQSIGPSAAASVLSVNIQGWSPLGLTGLISLLSKGLSRVFSSTTVRGGGNGNPLQYSCLENPMNSVNRFHKIKLQLTSCRFLIPVWLKGGKCKFQGCWEHLLFRWLW